MTATVPVPNKSPGDLLTTTLWNTYVAANFNKLLNQAHRKLTVAQFSALTDIEDGDEAYLEVDAANGIEWHLRYCAAEATYKWRFLGGPPMSAEVVTNESTASTAFAALATAGPSITLPRAGDYDIDLRSRCYASGAASGFHSYDIGVTGALDADATTAILVSVSHGVEGARRRRKAGLTAVALVSKYRVTANTAWWGNRSMTIFPVRIRHDA